MAIFWTVMRLNDNFSQLQRLPKLTSCLTPSFRRPRRWRRSGHCRISWPIQSTWIWAEWPCWNRIGICIFHCEIDQKCSFTGNSRNVESGPEVHGLGVHLIRDPVHLLDADEAAGRLQDHHHKSCHHLYDASHQTWYAECDNGQHIPQAEEYGNWKNK